MNNYNKKKQNKAPNNNNNDGISDGNKKMAAIKQVSINDEGAKHVQSSVEAEFSPTATGQRTFHMPDELAQVFLQVWKVDNDLIIWSSNMTHSMRAMDDINNHKEQFQHWFTTEQDHNNVLVGFKIKGKKSLIEYKRGYKGNINMVAAEYI